MKSSQPIQTTTPIKSSELMMKMTFSLEILYSWTVSGRLRMELEFDPGGVHDVFQIDEPAQIHLQRHKRHGQEKQDGDGVTGESLVEIKIVRGFVKAAEGTESANAEALRQTAHRAF